MALRPGDRKRTAEEEAQVKSSLQTLHCDLRCSIHVIHNAGVVVGEEEGVFAEAEDVGGAAVDFCAVVEAGDEVFDRAAGGFVDFNDLVTSSQRSLGRAVEGDEEGVCECGIG